LIYELLSGTDSVIYIAVTSFFFRIAMQREKKIKTIQYKKRYLFAAIFACEEE